MRELTLAPHSANAVNCSFSERLAWAKKRIDELDAFRINNALSHSSEPFLHVFSLVPLLIHYNSPSLPAYVENAPQGIADFQLTPFQSEYLTRSKIFPTALTQPKFEGLYLMGSIGSITQTSLSDLDLWLCHSQNFSADEQTLLNQKLALIKQWAESLGVEVNFYLMNPQEFQAKKYRSDTCDEHTGSAQHFFLLDEFYRSAIRLAGKRILWLHLDTQGQNYHAFVEQAVQNGELNTKEWIDFGDFSALSAGEFFGASLWQLYKGIKSPYKSVIKILLLESYAQTYPKTDLISKKFKALLLAKTGVCYHFDPYLAMLEQVTHYLFQQKSIRRLSFLRHCFYIKAHEGQNNPCRLLALKKLAEKWKWRDKEIAVLNQRSQWKVKLVAHQHKTVVDNLMLSYRNLLQFARKFQIDPNIMPQDVDFLMRKLYSAFEHTSGKIELINEKGRDNLAEKHLTFIDVSNSNSVKTGWYMLNHAPFVAYDSLERFVQYQPNLIMSIAWAYFNGLITANTAIHSVNEQVPAEKLRQFITDLRLSFPLFAPKVTQEELHSPHEIRNLIMAVNLVKDPTFHRPPFNKNEIEQLDLFNLSSSDIGAIGSIDIIYRNMWNEVITHHFEGQNVLFKALKLISNRIYLSSAPPQSVKVFCYSHQLQAEIQQFVLNLVNRCISVKTGSVFQRVQPQIVQLGSKKWQLVFTKDQELKEIVEKHSSKNHNCLPTIPSDIYGFVSEGFLQFFFDDNTDGSFNVYVSDKQNKTESYHYCHGSKQDKIHTIARLYSQSSEMKGTDAETFNFPQFYQILRQNDEIVIVPFQSKQHRDFLDNIHKDKIKENLCQ